MSTVDLGYAFENAGDSEVEGVIVPVFQDKFDRHGWEQMMHSIPQEELEVFVCLYLGMTPQEIVKVLGFTNIIRYYNVSSKLRKVYRERKAECLDYN